MVKTTVVVKQLRIASDFLAFHHNLNWPSTIVSQCIQIKYALNDVRVIKRLKYLVLGDMKL